MGRSEHSHGWLRPKCLVWGERMPRSTLAERLAGPIVDWCRRCLLSYPVRQLAEPMTAPRERSSRIGASRDELPT
jgi:hypothetical protein